MLMSYKECLLYEILLLPCFVGCMLYVGIPGVAGIGVTAGAGERGNNGLDVAIILDPPGLNCPNQEEKTCPCKRHGLLFQHGWILQTVS